MSGERLRQAALALVFAAVMAALAASVLGYRLERDLGLSTLYALRGDVAPPPEAIVVALDQRSSDWLSFHANDLARVSDRLPGCLPESTRAELGNLRSISDMPRGVHACLMEELTARGARVVVFDILFSIQTPDDPALAAAIEAGPPVVLFERIRGEVEQGAGRGSAALPLQRVHPRQIFVERAAATSSFLVNAPTGNFVEGYVARVRDFPDLLAMPEVTLGVYEGRPPESAVAEDGAEKLIWLYGPPKAIPTWGLREVFDRESARPLPEDLSDVAVFVGVSDPEFLGTKDHFKIPISDAQENDIGGVELAAAAFLNLLHGHDMTRPGQGAEAGIVFAFCLMLAMVAQFVGGWRGIAFAIGLGFVYAAAASLAFTGARLWLPLAVPVFVGLPFLVFWTLMTRYAMARRMVGRLAPRQVAAGLLDRSEAAAREIRTEAATVLFTDVVGSTALGDTMDPDSYSRVINHYYEEATRVVEQHHGMVIEFMGDGIIAVFTESVTGKDHASAGIAAARGLSAAIRSYRSVIPADEPGSNAAMVADTAAHMRLRMGVHSGETATGGMGGQTRFNFKVLGDTVNTAARLEQLGKAFDDGWRDVILVSEETRILSGAAESEFETLGEFALRGKRDAILVSRLQDVSTT